MRRLDESQPEPTGPQYEDLVKAAFEGSKVLEALVQAQRKVGTATTQEERQKYSQEYFEVLHSVVHADEALVMTIINAGITAISELFDEENK